MSEEMIVDINEIKAGPYEVVAVQFDQQTSKPGEPFDFTRYRTGDVVTLDAADARRLVLAGAVIEPGSRERAEAEAARAFYEAALAALPQEARDEHLATQASQQDSLDELLAAREQLLAEIAGLKEQRDAAGSAPATPVTTGPVTPAGGPAPATPGVPEQAPPGATEGAPAAEGSQEPPAPVRPNQVAAKALWVDYRIGQGMPAEAAEVATKNQLIKAEPPTFEIIGE